MRRAPLWADLVYQRRAALCLSVRAVAKRAATAPKYIRLMEFEGRVPSRELVTRVAEVLDVNVDVALLAAGYAPQSPHVMQAALEAIA